MPRILTAAWFVAALPVQAGNGIPITKASGAAITKADSIRAFSVNAISVLVICGNKKIYSTVIIPIIMIERRNISGMTTSGSMRMRY